MQIRPPTRRRGNSALAAAFALFSPPGVAAEGLVTIEGGSDTAGHEYEWTLTNHHDHAVIALQIPHFAGDLCLPPDPARWHVNMTHVNARDGRPGVCDITAVDEQAGIAPGASGRVRLRVGPRGAPRGSGEIIVKFADGTQTSVAARLPVSGSSIDRYASLIGLSLMFGIYIVYRRFRPPRSPGAAGPSR